MVQTENGEIQEKHSMVDMAMYKGCPYWTVNGCCKAGGKCDVLLHLNGGRTEDKSTGNHPHVHGRPRKR